MTVDRSIPALSAEPGPRDIAQRVNALLRRENVRQGVDIRIYGAKGDGTTDDSDAFSAAIESGLSIFVPEGVFLVSSQIVLDGIGIYGIGPGSIIRASGAGFNIISLKNAGCRVRDLTIQGAAVDNTTSQCGITTDTVNVPSEFEISCCHFGGPDSGHSLNTGIYLQGHGESLFRIFGNHFENLIGIISGTGYGVLAGPGIDGVIVGNTFKGVRGSLGRHAVYLSAGVTRIVVANNVCDSFSYEAYTLNHYSGQPVSDSISFIGNIAYNCGGDGLDQSSISVFGGCKNVLIADNQIIGSVGTGIFTNANGLAANDIRISGNKITDPNYFGIATRGTKFLSITGNIISGASRKTSQTYGDIDVATDGTTAPDVLVSGNKGIGVSGVSRTPFNVNTTAPAPTSVKVSGNDFPALNYFTGPTYNVATVPIWIDGRLQAIGAVNFANTAAGASTAAATIAVKGAVIGDIVTVSHEQTPDGWINFGRVSAADTVSYWGFNGTAFSQDPPSGTLRVDVWKRDGHNL